MKVYREDKLVWEKETFPRFNVGEILTIVKKDGTRVEGTVQSIMWGEIIILDTTEKVRLSPEDVDTVTINYHKANLCFMVESKTVPYKEGSFYVAEFHIDQADHKNIVISSVRKPGKPTKDELGRFSLMSGKYRELSFYAKWDDVPLIQNALASYMYGRILNPSCDFNIISVQVWGYDADLGCFVDYKLPTLTELNIVRGGMTLEQAYATLFKDFNIDHWR